MTEIDNILYIDDREKRDVQVLAEILHDNVEITRLEIGDALMRGVIFELKKPDDFVSSVFDKRLFTQIANMTEKYQHAFVLVSSDYRTTEMLYDSRSKRPNFAGVVGSCVARGCLPLFTSSIDNSLKLIDIISAKLTDGKVRARPVKTVSLKDKQLGIVCSLPGISEKRAKALLTHFGSIINIFDATEEELMEIPRLGPKIASKIVRLNRKAYKE
jgi:ERCC4-type nuclease